MRLKVRHMLIGAFVAAAAVSCTSELVDEDLAGGNGTDGISFVVADDYTRGGSFGNRPGSSTRASLFVGTNYPSAIAVYGDMTNIDRTDRIVIFNGEEVTRSDSTWSYSNPRYWFTDHEYSFVAMYPKEDANLSDLKYENSNLSFKYTLPEDYESVTDMLISGHRREATKDNVANKVTFGLGHILSRINFKAQFDSSIALNDIEFKNISISGIASEGTYSVYPADIISGDQTYDLNTSGWILSENSNKITISKDNFDETHIETPIEDGVQYVYFFPNKYAMLVIPQTVSNDVLVKLTYSIKGEETTIEGRLRAASSVHDYRWTSGRSYTYTFSIGPDDCIIFSKPQVDSWETGQGGNYIVVG